jgi:hypothetical protein
VAHAVEFDLDVEPVQRNRVAERNPLCRALGRSDRGQAGDRERVTLGQPVLAQ